MNLSFYTAASSVSAQQNRMNVIANNIANTNTEGYKTLTAAFAGLLYQNVREPEPAISPARHGVGAKVARTDINFNAASLLPTDFPLDFAIIGEGFFAVQDPGTEDIFYTRTGSFQMSLQADGQFFLVTPTGEYVLDADMQPIALESASDDDVNSMLGVFTFAHYEGFTANGKGFYTPAEKNGPPILNEEALVRRGMVEMSNVELAKEFSDMIITQRLYQMSLRMVTASDEIEGTINALRR